MRALAAVLPVHRIAVAALVAFHVLRLSSDVLTLMTPWTDQMRLVDDAPRLGAILADFEALFGNTELHLVHLEHHPGLPGVFDDAIPRSEERRVGKECRSRWAR